MKNWLNEIISDLKSKSITQKKLNEAYVLEDSKYLRKAYRNARRYLKIQIVGYLGEISTQENFVFLIQEMKMINNERLKSFVYSAIMNIVYDQKIQVSDSDSKYLNQNLALLDNIDFEPDEPIKSKPEPLIFRDKLRDHLGILEGMKKRFSSF